MNPAIHAANLLKLVLEYNLMHAMETEVVFLCV